MYYVVGIIFPSVLNSLLGSQKKRTNLEYRVYVNTDAKTETVLRQAGDWELVKDSNDFGIPEKVIFIHVFVSI